MSKKSRRDAQYKEIRLAFGSYLAGHPEVHEQYTEIFNRWEKVRKGRFQHYYYHTLVRPFLEEHAMYIRNHYCSHISLNDVIEVMLMESEK